MNRHSRAPRGSALGSQAAGRGGESAKDGLPRGDYHGHGRGARPELVRVWTPQGMKTAGAFVREGDELTFVKKGDARQHMLRWPTEAWAVDVGALEEASRRGVQHVVVRDAEAGTWWARLADFERHGVPINRGWGAQCALGKEWWSFVPHDSVTAKQGSLFGEVANG